MMSLSRSTVADVQESKSISPGPEGSFHFLVARPELFDPSLASNPFSLT